MLSQPRQDNSQMLCMICLILRVKQDIIDSVRLHGRVGRLLAVYTLLSSFACSLGHKRYGTRSVHVNGQKTVLHGLHGQHGSELTRFYAASEASRRTFRRLETFQLQNENFRPHLTRIGPVNCDDYKSQPVRVWPFYPQSIS